jgi:hypothetical protein
MWPSDDVLQAFLELIDRRLATPELEEETRSKLQRLRGSLTDVGNGTASGILVELANVLLHLIH